MGTSIEEARDADGKRRVQKRENKIFDIKPEAKMMFEELTNWYLGLEKVKATKTFWRIELALRNFNKHLGCIIVGQVKPVDLEEYQVKRRADGVVDAAIDKEVSMAHTMLNRAFFNDLVGGDTLKVFKRVARLTKHNANARNRVLSLDEYGSLEGHLPAHLKPVVATAFYTGMRRGEILNLTWASVDLRNRLIRLRPQDTKEGKSKVVPIGKTLQGILSAIPSGVILEAH